LGTGISISSNARHGRGFTLIEMLVVVFIIGLVSAGAILAFGSSRRDTQLEEEASRIDALFAYTREQAELQTRDYGLRADHFGYYFVVYDVLADQWRPVDEDDAMRERKFPEGIRPEMVVEGRQIVLEAKQKDIKDFTPQIILFANGDISSFELNLQGEAGDISKIYTDDDSHVVLLQPGEKPPEPVKKLPRRT
jgi:general secretion pathway protein H